METSSSSIFIRWAKTSCISGIRAFSFGRSAHWEKAKSLEALNKAKGFIRKELGQRLKIYYTPEITFEEDKSLDYGMHIEGLLKKVHDEEKDKAPKEDTEKED